MPYESPLTSDEMSRIMGDIMTGRIPPEEISTFLEILAARGETAEEIAAGAQVLRHHAVEVPVKVPQALCDTCGTGGDGQGTINASTLAALVAASAGVRIAKHGNRAASSKCGSADLLEALGVNLNASPKTVARCIDELGFGFCFAPAFHPAMKIVAPVRKVLKIRTIFNLIGPLANPAPLTFQLVGVSEIKHMSTMAEALQKLGRKHAMVVFGSDGMDEVTTTGPTAYVELKGGQTTTGTLEPEALGVARASREDLRGGDPAQNAAAALQILGGTPSPQADLVAVNAGVAIYIADRAMSPAEGVEKAKQVLASGDAARLLERVKGLSHAG